MHKAAQQFEFARGKVDGPFFSLGNVRVFVQGDAACRYLIRGLRVFQTLAATQKGTGARKKLAHAEGLCKIVVGSQLEPYDFVQFAVACRKKQDGRGHLRADAAAQFVSVDARQHDVQNEQIEVVALDFLECFFAV